MLEADNLDNVGQMRGKMLTGEEVARILKVSRAFAFQLMRTGEIPTIRLGRRSVRVRVEDLETFINSKVSQNK